MIPLLLRHDHNDVIGYLDTSNDRLLVIFSDHVTVSLDEMTNIFGGAGFRVIEHWNNTEGKTIIKRAEILEFSLMSEIK